MPDQQHEAAGEALQLLLMRLGPVGLYQRYVLLMLCVPNVLAAMYCFNHVFVADRVPFRCVVPECEGEGSHFEDEAVAGLLPGDECRRYEPLHPERLGCSRSDFHPNTTMQCTEFTHENADTLYAESEYTQALLYGGCSVSAALLVLLAPETRRAPLPQRASRAPASSLGTHV